MTKEANAFTASDIGNSDAKEDHNEREDLAHMPPISLQTGDSAGIQLVKMNGPKMPTIQEIAIVPSQGKLPRSQEQSI
ncbi:hypothetical protein N7456_004012 [Penicillium angulare]|uniref:Uncharacterized protein n=1 Tax=Penicillium angulare TaxID=116970 RepID=A0A9W9FVU7_9EURO|nr:hypothetical protein N7456_004012 [Penicillium angulare]